MKYYSVNLYRKMLDCALREGIAEQLLQELPTPLGALENIQAVPAEEFFALHEFLDRELGPGFAVRVGQQMKIEDYGVLGLSWRTCSWAGEIFERSERYFKMLSDTFVWQIVADGDISHIRLNREPHRRGMELSTEASLSATVVVLKAMTEQDIRPVQVQFKHAQPQNLASYTSAFGCPIRFNRDHYAISYRTSDLQTRTAKADASINKFLLERVQEETRGLIVAGNKLVVDVETLVREALPSGIPSIERISAHLGMSKRTLTRRLAESSVSFRDVVQRSQESAAKQLLRQTKRSLAEIAFETGFSEQSAFNRAFKRWTGISPLEYRNS